VTLADAYCNALLLGHWSVRQKPKFSSVQSSYVALCCTTLVNDNTERALTFNPAHIQRDVKITAGSESRPLCIESKVFLVVDVDFESQGVAADRPRDRVSHVVTQAAGTGCRHGWRCAECDVTTSQHRAHLSPDRQTHTLRIYKYPTQRQKTCPKALFKNTYTKLTRINRTCRTCRISQA